MTTLVLFLLITLAAVVPSRPQTLDARCGDCWCVPEGGTDTGTCPTNTSGIYQSFPDSYPTLYETFTLTSTPITLQASDGSGDCFPFADSIGALGYDESKYPACQLSTGDTSASGGSSSAVCGYKFAGAPSSASDCLSRQYELLTYDSSSAAESDGALTVHSGHCGVCSDAQDLAVRMSTFDSLQTKSITCATQFAFGGGFANLVSCYETIGFTTQCATLWAHFAASNAALCADVCAGQISLNGDPPLCELGSCLSCSQNFEPEFNDLAGLYKSPYNAGFNVDIAYPCSYFTRIPTLDPCFSANAATPAPAPTAGAETPAPTPTEPETTAAPTAAEPEATAAPTASQQAGEVPTVAPTSGGATVATTTVWAAVGVAAAVMGGW